ncbi:hypothetical protein EYZ11_005800 [Aspergillus tanneri]|uniref:Uncharacterized protein n=1 Tax=Aspergillus tanneri TaxID=1220188 RepID=A0A4S3JHI4_9EURO|nr:hypothetical protein EYZ11_005800 [Aspergillus tanneri]
MQARGGMVYLQVGTTGSAPSWSWLSWRAEVDMLHETDGAPH